MMITNSSATYSCDKDPNVSDGMSRYGGGPMMWSTSEAIPFVPADVEAPIAVVLHFRTISPRNDVNL